MALSQPGRMSGDIAPAYVRHKPEQTLLYQLVEQYWPEFQAQLNETGRFLPRHVTREFEDYLACGRLENGFLRVRCQLNALIATISERVARYLERQGWLSRDEQSDHLNLALDEPIGMGRRTLCSSLWISWPNWQHWCPSLEQISRGRLYALQGAGTISWSTGAEQSVPRERDIAQCSQGRACQR